MSCWWVVSMMSTLVMVFFLPGVLSTALHYCNSSYFTGFLVGDGAFFFDANLMFSSWSSAQSGCRNWALPSHYKQATFAPGDIMNSNSTAQSLDLASLWNINNFNLVGNYVTGGSSSGDYAIGLAQTQSCNQNTLPGVFEPSFNWTWSDGTPLLWNTQGQGLPFFEVGEPTNRDGSVGTQEHHGILWKSSAGLNDYACNLYQMNAICSIPGRVTF
jgi:hypothetical protein